MRDGTLNCAFMVKSIIRIDKISCRVISASNHTNVLFKRPYAVSFYKGVSKQNKKFKIILILDVIDLNY